MRDGPPRGGTRGGRDQFDWEQVKADAHRENYLGASVKAPVGRWQQGRDLLWYTRDAGRPDGAAAAHAAIEDEREAVRAREDALMREALGMPPAPVPARGPDGLERGAAGEARGGGRRGEDGRRKRERSDAASAEREERRRERKREKKERKKEKRREEKRGREDRAGAADADAGGDGRSPPRIASSDGNGSLSGAQQAPPPPA